MVGYFETMLLGNLVLHNLDMLVDEFSYAAALAADQMIMVFDLVGRFKAGKTVLEIPGMGQVRFGQEFKGPVDRGVPYFRHPLFDQMIKLLGADMLPLGQKGLDDLLSLPG
jgi:hypothetical protein